MALYQIFFIIIHQVSCLSEKSHNLEKCVRPLYYYCLMMNDVIELNVLSLPQGKARLISIHLLRLKIRIKPAYENYYRQSSYRDVLPNRCRTLREQSALNNWKTFYLHCPAKTNLIALLNYAHFINQNLVLSLTVYQMLADQYQATILLIVFLMENLSYYN